MEVSRCLILFFSISSCLFFVLIQDGLHVNKYTKQKQLHTFSRISLPPSPAPEAAAAAPYSPTYNNGNSPSDSAVVFDVRSFGAVGDGVNNDTQAFKMAWDTACQAESAILLVPDGFSFMIQSTIFTGPCKTGLVFQIDGTIMPPDGPDSWPPKNSKRQWLVFYRINGMSMQGGGLVDGRGEKWWDLPCKPHKGNGRTLSGSCDSPVAIRFFMSSNLTVRGLRIKNSPQFHFRFDICQNVHIDLVTIKAPSQSPNTDGIHIENTSNVTIYNSVISNGIRNSRACVSNITVTDSVIKHSDNGVRIKTWQGGSGSVSRVTFSNILMDTVRNPIIIDQYYCLTKHCANQTSAVFISDILYMKIKGTFDVRSPPMHLACSDSVPCTNLTISDVELLPSQSKKTVANPFCWNAYGNQQALTVPPFLCLLGGIPGSLPDNDVDRC
ncbi:hypothetical protein L1049_020603 [Liquidambar formosana]|uniref:Polygalacturonase n=1 Tax=Liquidambar formosana TaxID=63359 RepID=A0AAP0X9Z7_LIQFO